MAQKVFNWNCPLPFRRTQDLILTFQSRSILTSHYYFSSPTGTIPLPVAASYYAHKSWIQNPYLLPTVRNIHICTSIQQKQRPKPSSSASQEKSLAESREGSGSQVTLSLGEKVKENVKTSAYGSVILIGLAVTGAMAYVILSELFSSESPNNIYTKSFKICKADTRVQDLLGTPIKCYGEETRRGWRRHVAHQQFIHGTTKIIRMKFYIEGKHRKGTVHLEKKTNANGKYEYSYLLVDVDSYPPQRIEIDASRF